MKGSANTSVLVARAAARVSLCMEHNDGPPAADLPPKRTRRAISYRDMENDDDFEDIENTKKEKKSKKKGAALSKRKRLQPSIFSEEDMVGSGLDDEEIDALNPEQLRSEIEKVKAQITRLEDELKKEPEVTGSLQLI